MTKESPFSLIRVDMGKGMLTDLLNAAGLSARIAFDLESLPFPKNLQVRPGRLLVIEPDIEPVNDNLDEGCIDSILVLYVLDRLDLLELFHAAFDCLEDNGNLVLLDTMSLRPNPQIVQPYVEFVIAQGARCGFLLVDRQDGVTTPPLIGNRELISLPDYAPSRLIFVRQSAPAWRLYPVRTENALAFCHLFERVFNVPMNPVHWEWKYGEGRGDEIWADAQKEMVGHLGIMYRQVICQGRQVMAGQLGDLMVSDDQRGGLRGLFYQLCCTITERHVGYGAKSLIGFGFSPERLMNYYEHMGLAERTDRMIQIVWPSLSQRWDLCLDSRPIDLVRDVATIDRLWQAMRMDHKNGLIGVRDAAYLDYRFNQHPAIQYKMYLVIQRWTRRPLGVVVLKIDTRGAVLVDVIGALTHLPVLVKKARCLAHLAGKPTLTLWIDAAHAHFFMDHDAQRSDLDVLVLCTTCTPSPELAPMRNRWWMTMGDTDFL